MSITETFEEVAHEFKAESLQPRVPKRDGNALYYMRKLSDNMYATKHLPYAWGSWGYTSTSFQPYLSITYCRVSFDK